MSKELDTYLKVGSAAVLGFTALQLGLDTVNSLTSSSETSVSGNKVAKPLQPEGASYLKQVSNKELVDRNINLEARQFYINQGEDPETPQDLLDCMRSNDLLRDFFALKGLNIDKLTLSNIVPEKVPYKLQPGQFGPDLPKKIADLGLGITEAQARQILNNHPEMTFRLDGQLTKSTTTMLDNKAEVDRRRAAGEKGIFWSGENYWLVTVGGEVIVIRDNCINPLATNLVPMVNTATAFPTKTATSSPIPTYTPVSGETPTHPTMVPQTPLPTNTPGVGPTETPVATASAIPTHTPGEGTPTIPAPTPTVHNTMVPQTPLPTNTPGVGPTETPVATASPIPTYTPVSGETPTHPTMVPQTPLPTNTPGVGPTETPVAIATAIPTKQPSGNTPTSGGSTPVAPRPTMAPGSRSSGLSGEYRIGDFIYKVSTTPLKKQSLAAGHIDFINGKWETKITKVA